MKIRVEQEIVILSSIIKWLFLATIVGSLAGVAASLFISAIHWITEKSTFYPNAFYFLPVSLVVATFLGNRVLKFDLSTDKLISIITRKDGRVNVKAIPIKVLNALIIIGTGGSAGKESPCAQMGAGISSLFSDLFRLDNADRKKLVICGFSAGFSCVFGTPIAGALYGIEVLFIGVIMYDVLFPSFVASITAYHVSTLFGITYFHYPLEFVPVFNQQFFIFLIIAAIFFGFCSLGFIELLTFSKAYIKKIKINEYLKAAIGGTFLILLTMGTSTEYLGLGLTTMENCMRGGSVEWYSFLLKAVFTVVTLGITRSGSIITPILFIGATAGNLFGSVFDLDLATFSALGFVSLLAGTTNTPISMSIMAIEMFGAEIAPYAAVSCVLSFLMSGHRSLYSSQVLTLSKSRSIVIETGKELKEIKNEFRHRKKSGFAIFRKYLKVLINKIKKL